MLLSFRCSDIIKFQVQLQFMRSYSIIRISSYSHSYNDSVVQYKKVRCAVLHVSVCFFIQVNDLLSILQSYGNGREKDEGRKPYRVDTDGHQRVTSGSHRVAPSDTQAP